MSRPDRPPPAVLLFCRVLLPLAICWPLYLIGTLACVAWAALAGLRSPWGLVAACWATCLALIAFISWRTRRMLGR